MIEIIISIAVLLFGIVLVYSAFAGITFLTNNVSSGFAGSYLAQEGLEIVRNLRDDNFISGGTWSAGLLGGSCSVGCMADYKTNTTGQLTPYNNNTFLSLNSDGFYSYDLGGSLTIFKRKITISSVGGTSDAIYVDVMVYWSYNGQPSSYEAGEYLYNWY